MEKGKNKRIFEKTLGVFAWLALLLAIITSILATCAAFSGENNGKEIFGHKILIVNTDSMSKSATSQNEPIFFDAGDVIVIRKVEDPSKLKVGDVITFFSFNAESMGKTVSHKIREIKYSSTGQVTGFVTYGINTGVNDMVEVKPEHLIGKYVFKVPNMGTLFAFLKTPRGYYVSILTPSVLLIIFFSIKVGKVLGKKEFAKEYNQEIDSIKEKIGLLEGQSVVLPMGATGSANYINDINIMDEDMRKNREKIEQEMNNAQVQDQTQQQEQAPAQQSPVVYQTINITYTPSPYMVAPVICQTAPSQDKPVHQSINIAPSQAPVVCPQAPTYQGVQPTPQFVYASMPMQQPIISQTAGGCAVQPQPVMYQGYPTISQTVGNVQVPQQAPVQPAVQTAQPQQAPVQAEPVAQPVVSEQPVPQPVAEEVSATEQVVEDVEDDGNDKLSFPESKKKPFSEKLIESKETTQNHFNELHNQLISYKKVSSRISYRGASYRKGRTLIAKIGIRGKTLSGYFNLNVEEFNKNVYFQKDMSSVKAYQEVPFAVKIKSDRACANAIKLADAVAEKFELQKNPKFEKVDFVKQLKNKENK